MAPVSNPQTPGTMVTATGSIKTHVTPPINGYSMSADDLGMQGARPSAVMFNQDNNQVWGCRITGALCNNTDCVCPGTHIWTAYALRLISLDCVCPGTHITALRMPWGSHHCTAYALGLTSLHCVCPGARFTGLCMPWGSHHCTAYALGLASLDCVCPGAYITRLHITGLRMPWGLHHSTAYALGLASLDCICPGAYINSICLGPHHDNHQQASHNLTILMLNCFFRFNLLPPRRLGEHFTWVIFRHFLDW